MTTSRIAPAAVKMKVFIRPSSYRTAAEGENTGGRASRFLRDKLPQHERQDAAVAVVLNLDGRVYPERHGHLFDLAPLASDAQRHVLTWLDVALDADDIENLVA